MNSVEFNWKWGRVLMGGPTALMTRLHVYGKERMPRKGGIVVAMNNFSWADIPAYGWATPRPLYYLAKAEAHDVPVAGAYLRLFGSFAVRRGESDRDARKQIYAEIQLILSEDLPYIDLWYIENVMVHNKRVRKLTLNPPGNYDFLKTAELAP